MVVHRDAIVILVEAVDLKALPHLHVRKRVHDSAQALFEVRLVEPVAVAPSVVGRRLPVDLHQDFAVFIHPEVTVIVVVDGGVVVGIDSQRGKDARDFVVEGDGAGEGIGLWPAVDTDDVVPLLTQKQARKQTGRSESDDDDVGFFDSVRH